MYSIYVDIFLIKKDIGCEVRTLAKDVEVSIVIPVFNSERYISMCLDSILAQDYHDFEVLIVDDGSTDKSGQICDTYQLKDNRIKVLHIRNSGVSVARNIAIKKASGKFLAFCDSDDVWASNYLTIMIEQMNNNHVDLVACSFTEFSEKESSPFDSFDLEKYEVEEYRKDEILNQILNNKKCKGYIWNKLFRMSNVIKNLLFKENITINEDELFVLQYIDKNTRLCMCKVPLYGYRSNASGVMNSRKLLDSINSLQALELIYGRISELTENPRIQIEVLSRMTKLASYCYGKVLVSNMPEKKEWKKRIRDMILPYNGLTKFDQTWNVRQKIGFIVMKIGI